MQDKTPQTEQGFQQTAGGTDATGNIPSPEKQLPPLSFWKLPVALFIYPRMALLNARVHRLWGKGLLLTLLVTAIAAIGLAVQTEPVARKHLQDLHDLCESTLGSLTYNPGTQTLGWTKDVTLPTTQRKRKWQLDVLAKQQDFDPAKAKEGLQPGGIIVARDGISAWMRNGLNHSVKRMQFLPQESLPQLFQELGENQNGTFVITRNNVERLTPVLAPMAACTVAIVTAIYYLKMVLTCVVLFVIMSMLCNRSEKGAFGAVCASSLTCTFPPFALALAFSFVPGIPVEVDTLFTIFFVIYLIVILLDRSVVIRRLQK